MIEDRFPKGLTKEAFSHTISIEAEALKAEHIIEDYSLNDITLTLVPYSQKGSASPIIMDFSPYLSLKGTCATDCNPPQQALAYELANRFCQSLDTFLRWSYLQVGLASHELMKLSPEDARFYLYQLGFTNVSLDSRPKYWWDFMKKAGSIEKIAINGDDKFLATAFFTKDASIFISYIK